MEPTRDEQLEALQVMSDYLPKLITGMKNVSAELDGKQLPDTKEYLNKVIEGINWIIQIVNQTLPLINEDNVKLDKAGINACITEFSNAYSNNDNNRLSQLLNGELLTIIQNIQSAITNII